MLNISTINFQNRYKQKKYDGITELGQDNIQLLIDFLKEYDIDIAGMQEINHRCLKRLKKLLNNYTFTGKKRFGDNLISHNIEYIKKFNEANTIISNRKITKTNTYRMPFFPSLLPRIVTVSYINTEDGEIAFINTHLEYLKNKVKLKQLKYILSLIKKIEKPIIMTGDFNLSIKNSFFKEFVEELKKMSIYRVPITKETLKNRNKAIDYIFLSKEYELVESNVIDDIKFSDHNPIVAKIKRKQV